MAEAHATLGVMNRLVRWLAAALAGGAVTWCAWATTAIGDIKSDVAVLKRRDGDASAVAGRVGDLERAVSAMASAREQNVIDWRANNARLEGRIDALSRDVQQLVGAMGALTGTVSALAEAVRKK